MNDWEHEAPLAEADQEEREAREQKRKKAASPVGEYAEHPSWGAIRFCRCEVIGKTRLFGSSLLRHGTTITLTIARAQRAHALGQDWLGGVSGPELIEVEMSTAQFATLLTSMNVGTGVPCTIRAINGERMPDVPEDPGEAGRTHEEFREDLQGIAANLSTLLESTTRALEARNLKAAERKELLGALERIKQDLERNMPFMLGQFEKATEKVVVAAKAEVDAFVTTMATNLGLERLRALASGVDDDSGPLLPDRKEEK